MKTLIVNTYDRGGAANSCLRLRRGLLDMGIDVKLLLQKKTKNFSYVEIAEPLVLPASKAQKAKKALRKILKEFKIYRNTLPKEVPFLWKRNSHLEMFSYPYSNFDITASQSYKEVEIINLHWVANFLDFNSFFEKNHKPVVWTLHDMNPFTGGEHYSELYTGINGAGFPIKRNFHEFELEEFEKVLSYKKNALKNCGNLSIVAPSKWLATEAKKSVLFKDFPVYHIPYGLDPEVFAPREKNFSRAILGLPIDRRIILFVADDTSIPRKGFEYLKRTLEQLEMEDVVLCSVGQKNEGLNINLKIFELGPIHDERLMSMIYSAADVFVIPSLMDNSPNTVLESLMCGTPVIGFPVGGIPEMITSGENGLISHDISVSALHKTIIEFFSSVESFNPIEIRKNAVLKYSLNVQSNRYNLLFKSILGHLKKSDIKGEVREII